MYIFINDISKTAFENFHDPLWSTNPESFMRFGNTRCKRGRDPMEIPIRMQETIRHIYLTYTWKCFFTAYRGPLVIVQV
jgi:hypothetical protein